VFVSEAVDPAPREPPEERLAARLETTPTPVRSRVAHALHLLASADKAAYRAIAETPMPTTIDEPLRRLSNLANESKLWLGIASVLFVFGGRTGRRAAITGAAAIGVNSVVVNLPMKYAARRARPDRTAAGVPAERWVDMPTSTSFPSGHSASGFAFATAVAGTVPALGFPLRGLAATIAYSRVHTGVHYPGDVIAGSLIGASLGGATAVVARRIRRRRSAWRTATALPTS
jgi:undecaprenyl-diphosphatase